MKRSMINFSDRQWAALREEAFRREIPISDVVRRLVENHFGLEHDPIEMGRPYRSPVATAEDLT